LHDFRLARP